MTDSAEIFDPASRRLCPDGNCVGLLDAENRCKVCGRPGESAPLAGFPTTADTKAPFLAAPSFDDLAEGGNILADADHAFDASRRLCPDGDCIGVIGPDGRCGVCGCASAG